MNRLLISISLIIGFFVIPNIAFCQDEWVEEQLNAANELVNQDRIQEAIVQLEKVLRSDRGKKMSHDDRIDIMSEIGSLYALLGDYERSQTYLGQALKTKQKAYGPNHPLVGELMLEMGETAMTLENFEVAESYFEKALEIQSAAGDEYIVREILLRMADLKELHGQPDDAAALRLQVEDRADEPGDTERKPMHASARIRSPAATDQEQHKERSVSKPPPKQPSQQPQDPPQFLGPDKKPPKDLGDL